MKHELQQLEALATNPKNIDSTAEAHRLGQRPTPPTLIMDVVTDHFIPAPFERGAPEFLPKQIGFYIVHSHHREPTFAPLMRGLRWASKKRSAFDFPT